MTAFHWHLKWRQQSKSERLVMGHSDVISEIHVQKTIKVLVEVKWHQNIKKSEITFLNQNRKQKNYIWNLMSCWKVDTKYPVYWNYLICFPHNYYPETWAKGYITSIFKSNNPLGPNNCFVINITSNLGNAILNSRLDIFLGENNLIHRCQVGFIKSNIWSLFYCQMFNW